MIEICREHCTAGMLEADRQFRRVNGHMPLPELRAALNSHFAENVSPACDDEEQNAASWLPKPSSKFNEARDKLLDNFSTGRNDGYDAR